MKSELSGKGRRVQDVDPTFDPWEQSRPIPLFVLAIFLALAIWGALSYIADLAPNRGAAIGGTVAPKQQALAVPDDAPVLVFQGNDIVWACASCHGDHGAGAGLTPALAGLSEAYIAKQLHDFATGSRPNESMRYVASAMSAEEIGQVSAYYAALPHVAGPPVDLGGDAARGEALSRTGDWKKDIPACVTCHGQQGEGVGGHFPALAGQQPEYIFHQLVSWKGGHRHNSPQSLMDDIASRMSDQDMRDVAQYFGSLRPGSKGGNHDEQR